MWLGLASPSMLTVLILCLLPTFIPKPSQTCKSFWGVRGFSKLYSGGSERICWVLVFSLQPPPGKRNYLPETSVGVAAGTAERAQWEAESERSWDLTLIPVSIRRCSACVLSHFSRVWVFTTLWSVVHRAPLSMRFSRQEYWRGLPHPTPGNLPDQGSNPWLPCLLRCRWILYHWAIKETHRFPLLLLLLSRFSHVRLCATPSMAAHQAPPSLGFSRQEHWSGLPFPSPVYESEKWKWSRSVVSGS